MRWRSNDGPNDSVSLPHCLTLVFDLFRQEGWRLENENPSDANTPLIFKGVVFNEMKGAFVSHHFLLLGLLMTD